MPPLWGVVDGEVGSRRVMTHVFPMASASLPKMRTAVERLITSALGVWLAVCQRPATMRGVKMRA